MSWVPWILIFVLFILMITNFIFYFLMTTLRRNTNKRLSIPPKERKKKLKEIYNFMLDRADECGVKLFLTYGSLLGKVREHDIICHDFDLDFGVDDHGYEAIKERILENVPEGYVANVKDFLGFKSIEFIHKETRLNADISSYKLGGGNVSRCVPEIYSKYIAGERHYFDKNWLYPLQKVEFLGRECYLPNRPDKFLESWYSKNYMIPDKICDSNCMNCRPNPAARSK